MGFASLIPVGISLIGFILGILGLFAGNTPGFMEDYQVMMLNTSILGRQYVPNLANVGSKNKAREVQPFHITSHVRLEHVDNRTLVGRGLTLPAAEGVLAGFTAREAASKMAGVLGISQFYSLHLVAACEGTFAPNASAVSSWRNVSQCTSGLGPRPLNLSRLLDEELRQAFPEGDPTTGGTKGLAALQASNSLRAALNRIPTIGVAIGIFYVVGVIGAALGVVLPVVSLATRAARPRQTVLANLGVAASSALALLVAALVAAVGVAAAVDSINRLGAQTIGLSASKGTGFASLTWAAFAFMAMAAMYWTFELHRESNQAAAAAATAEQKAAASG